MPPAYAASPALAAKVCGFMKSSRECRLIITIIIVISRERKTIYPGAGRRWKLVGKLHLVYGKDAKERKARDRNKEKERERDRREEWRTKRREKMTRREYDVKASAGPLKHYNGRYFDDRRRPQFATCIDMSFT